MRGQLWWLIYSQYISQWKIKIYDMLPKSLQRQELLTALGRKIFLQWMAVNTEIDGCLRSHEWQVSLKQNIYYHAQGSGVIAEERAEGKSKKREKICELLPSQYMTQPVQSCSHKGLDLHKTGPFHSHSWIGESLRGPCLSFLDCSLLDSEGGEGTVLSCVFTDELTGL